MADFSADAEMRALARWEFEIGGRVYVASVVSRPQALAFWAMVERSKAGLTTPEEEEAATEALFRAAFPKKRWQWLFGDPVPQIMALPWQVRWKALMSFLDSLARTSNPSAPGMNGTNDSPPSSVAGNGSRHAPSVAAPAGASRLD